MIRSTSACEMARKLPDVSEKDHFGSDAFYANKRIFATVWHEKKQVNLKLSPTKQKHFLELDGDAFVAIENAWGKQGWTTVQLEFIDRDVFFDALNSAWENSANASKSKNVGNRKTTKKSKIKSK